MLPNISLAFCFQHSGSILGHYDMQLNMDKEESVGTLHKACMSMRKIIQTQL